MLFRAFVEILSRIQRSSFSQKRRLYCAATIKCFQHGALQARFCENEYISAENSIGWLRCAAETREPLRNSLTWRFACCRVLFRACEKLTVNPLFAFLPVSWHLRPDIPWRPAQSIVWWRNRPASALHDATQAGERERMVLPCARQQGACRARHFGAVAAGPYIRRAAPARPSAPAWPPATAAAARRPASRRRTPPGRCARPADDDGGGLRASPAKSPRRNGQQRRALSTPSREL